MCILILSKKGAKAPPVEPVEPEPVEEAPASKKDKAFELFAQGKEPGDPEIDALELAPATITRYYNLWKADS